MKKMILVLGMSLLSISAHASRIEKALQKFEGSYTSKGDTNCPEAIKIEAGEKSLTVRWDDGSFTIDRIGNPPVKLEDSDWIAIWHYYAISDLSLSGKRVASRNYGSPFFVTNGVDHEVRLTKDGVAIDHPYSYDDGLCSYKKAE